MNLNKLNNLNNFNFGNFNFSNFNFSNFNFSNFNFSNFIDVIQVFANEYCIPGNNILILGKDLGKELESIKNLFNFINCETFFVCDQYQPGIDFVVQYPSLPFEQGSFDIIINFLSGFDFNCYLKENGIILYIENKEHSDHIN